MKIVTLNAPSTVYCQWAESTDRRRHDLWLYVDGWEVAPSYSIAWLEGESLADAIEVEHLEPGEGPGWYVVDGCGDVCPDLEPLSHSGPFDTFAWGAIKSKWQALREAGAPPATPLREFRLPTGVFQAEDCRDGVLINPVLPEHFDDTPNNARSPLVIDRWWGRPFIVARPLEDSLEDVDSYASRLSLHGSKPSMTPEEWVAGQEELRRRRRQRYPSGTAYEVRCLDGGAWDRSTWWGDADNLEAALEIAKTGPCWRQQGGLLS
ncbi:hypothetical protein [Billgrantia montanilacus]|uniref:Uncharacterized protein n=1 Tax=Billgrantia montanilacus TaxID=2282305 RepID=A0A368TRC6_9GAMM|nr:hypothetical protein [Halomonas montanilacus]RCV86886.1 hypothetical protein DU505_18820 [Halomonas montanilacus]